MGGGAESALSESLLTDRLVHVQAIEDGWVVQVREVKVETEVDAAPQEIWEVLTNFASYGDWNPVFIAIHGVPREGANLEVRARPPGGRTITLHPQVAALEPPRRMQWVERWRIPGVMASDHVVELIPSGVRTRVVRVVRYRGLLVPLVWRLRGLKILAGFEQMNASLKARAENGSG